MSDADRSGVFRVVVCGEERAQGELFGEVHADHRADSREHTHEVPGPVTSVACPSVQVRKRALRLAYEKEKQLALAIDLHCSRQVVQRLLDVDSPRPVTAERVDRLPPLRRAIVRTFEELLARGVSDEDAVAVVRARKVG